MTFLTTKRTTMNFNEMVSEMESKIERGNIARARAGRLRIKHKRQRHAIMAMRDLAGYPRVTAVIGALLIGMKIR